MKTLRVLKIQGLLAIAAVIKFHTLTVTKVGPIALLREWLSSNTYADQCNLNDLQLHYGGFFYKLIDTVLGVI